jgi:hypothetical protein
VESAPEVPRISMPSAVVAGVCLGTMGLATVGIFGWKVVWPFASTGIAPADWTWPRVFAALVVMVAIQAYLGITIYRRFSTRLSAQGVSVPTLTGRRYVSWTDVRRVGVRGHEILLDAPSGIVVVNVYCFANAKLVGRYIQAHISSPPQ